MTKRFVAESHTGSNSIFRKGDEEYCDAREERGTESIEADTQPLGSSHIVKVGPLVSFEAQHICGCEPRLLLKSTNCGCSPDRFTYVKKQRSFGYCRESRQLPGGCNVIDLQNDAITKIIALNSRRTGGVTVMERTARRP